MISRTLLILLGFAMATEAFPLAATTFQNAVPNPDFSANANGWAKASGTGTFSWDGADGSPAAGSALIADSTVPSGAIATTSACTAITNGNFDFVARVKLGAGTNAVVTVTFFLTQCDLLHEITTTSISSFPSAVGNGWFEGSLINQMPPSNSPLFAQFSVQAYNSTGATSAHFDHIVYGLTGIADVIFADGFGG